MPDSFEHGDVKIDNTMVGDLVFYVRSQERGNFNGNYVDYVLVTVVKFTDKRVCIRYGFGHESFVKNWHLFSRDTIQKRTTSVKDIEQSCMREIITDSVNVSRNQEGDYEVSAFVIENECYEILKKFSGPGKFKKAKELATNILSQV